MVEDRITYVARKVVHLGDQLESSNSHRQRDIEALRLMEIMKEFQTKAKPSCPEFTDPTRVRITMFSSALLCSMNVMNVNILFFSVTRSC